MTTLISDDEVSIALRGNDELGEGPHWSAPEQTLYWVDIVNPALQSVKTDGNGLGWSNDNRVFFFTDSGKVTIYRYAFDLDSGALGERSIFVGPDPSRNGGPDGGTLLVTSARVGLTEAQLAQAPLSRSLFAIDSGTTDKPGQSFDATTQDR